MTIQTKVTAIQDGDTFHIDRNISLWDKIFFKIRIPNVDTPEENEHGYGEAKQALANLILGRVVKIEVIKISYDRLLAHVWVYHDGYRRDVNVSDIMRDYDKRYFR